MLDERAVTLLDGDRVGEAAVEWRDVQSGPARTV
jgi:hypothetical protein